MKMYRHFKGGHYEYLMEAASTDTGENLVIYRSLRDGKIWARRSVEFYENITVDGRLIPRFQRIPFDAKLYQEMRDYIEQHSDSRLEPPSDL